MWRELASEFDGVELHAPAPTHGLDALELRLGQNMPQELRALLTETNGLDDEYGTEAIWTVEKITQENLSFRANESYRSLYMPFDDLMFFGDNGGGDQFAFVRSPERDDIFVWDHETDSRYWIAPNLETFLRRTLESDGEDWYRS